MPTSWQRPSIGNLPHAFDGDGRGYWLAGKANINHKPEFGAPEEIKLGIGKLVLRCLNAAITGATMGSLIAWTS